MQRRLSAVVSELEELQLHVRQAVDPVLSVHLAQAQTIVASIRDEVAALKPPDGTELRLLVDLSATPQATTT